MFNRKLESIAQQRKNVVDLTGEFNESLQTFEESFHDECETKGCEHYQKKLRMLYKEYYTDHRPGRWDELRTAYREQLAADIQAEVPLEEIHARVLEEKRQARINQKDIIGEWRERELSNHPGDHPETIKFKLQATAMLNDGNALEDVLKFMNDEAHKVLSLVPGNRHDLLDRINTATSQGEKRQARKEWHTTSYEDDSPQTRELKQNLARMFDSDLPLEEIDTFIIQQKKQQDFRAGIQDELIRSKRAKIEENDYAWRAHRRSKQAKMERAASRAAEKKAAQIAHNTHSCSGLDQLGAPCRNSARPEDDERGPIECGVCNYANQNGVAQKRSFFCSEDCAKRSWDKHKAKVHPCDSAECLNEPTPRGAMCPDCDEIFHVKSHFCSPQCLDANKESHRQKVHEHLREKRKQQINEEFERDFAKFQTMTAEELQNEINVLRDRGVNTSIGPGFGPDEYEDMKKEFGILSSLEKEESKGGVRENI